jgi:hypothetical protein
MDGLEKRRTRLCLRPIQRSSQNCTRVFAIDAVANIATAFTFEKPASAQRRTLLCALQIGRIRVPGLLQCRPNRQLLSFENQAILALPPYNSVETTLESTGLSSRQHPPAITQFGPHGKGILELPEATAMVVP